jgi:hypothetical protein
LQKGVNATIEKSDSGEKNLKENNRYCGIVCRESEFRSLSETTKRMAGSGVHIETHLFRRHQWLDR